MGWEMLLLISPRQFCSPSSSHAVPLSLCVLLRMVWGCADVTCALP